MAWGYVYSGGESARPRLFDFLDCETPKLLYQKVETARHKEPLKNETARPFKFD